MSTPTPSRLQTLHPAYFALVMATGIISIACHLHGFTTIAKSLLVLNAGQYLILSALFVLRLVRFSPAVISDASDHLRGPGYFTIIAGTGVLAAQFYLVVDLPGIGMLLTVATIVFWLLILYSVFALLIVKTAKPPIEKGINGGWLVGIVATQSVVIVSVFAGTWLGGNQPFLILGGLLAWSFGVMFYIWVISLIFYRYMFFSFQPNDLSPPYWINMGAVAISTLAGCNLIGAAQDNALLMELRPFLKGFTFLLWSTATWWIPMLLILGFWRHIVRRFPFKYDPLYWGMVFPLGMYSACTYRVAQEFGLAMLFPLAETFLFVGAAAWTAVFAGMIYQIVFVAKPIAQPAHKPAAMPE